MDVFIFVMPSYFHVYRTAQSVKWTRDWRDTTVTWLCRDKRDLFTTLPATAAHFHVWAQLHSHLLWGVLKYSWIMLETTATSEFGNGAQYICVQTNQTNHAFTVKYTQIHNHPNKDTRMGRWTSPTYSNLQYLKHSMFCVLRLAWCKTHNINLNTGKSKEVVIYFGVSHKHHPNSVRL